MSKKYKVLLIDDETEHLEVIKKLVEAYGYSVYVASTVKRAIELIPYIDFALADVNMPDKELLTKTLETSNIPFARFSGSTEASDYKVVNFSLKKPVVRNELKDCLDWLKLLSSNSLDLDRCIKKSA